MFIQTLAKLDRVIISSNEKLENDGKEAK
jgi:hypothetical protein